jgi:large subunit ribosomal protein L40e
MALIAPQFTSNLLSFEPNDRIITLQTVTNKKAFIKYKQGMQTVMSVLSAFMKKTEYNLTDHRNYINDIDSFQIIANNKMMSPSDKNNPAILDTLAESNKQIRLHYGDYVEPMVKLDMDGTKSEPHKLTVKSLTGRNITIDCDLTTCTVAQFKVKIYYHEGIPEDQQRIIYEGRQLEDNKLLSEYNITNESSLHLVLRLRGGMYREESGRDGNYKPLSDIFFIME